MESSYCMTFSTIFGRCRYLVIPYGLIDSQDAFQAKMDQILEGLEGVVLIADDIMVNSELRSNMMIIWGYLWREPERSLIFNPDKCSLKADSVMFFGCLYGKNGVWQLNWKPYRWCQHILACENYKSSLGWLLTSESSSEDYLISRNHFQHSPRKMFSLSGDPPMNDTSTSSRIPYQKLQCFDTLTQTNL